MLACRFCKCQDVVYEAFRVIFGRKRLRGRGALLDVVVYQKGFPNTFGILIEGANLIYVEF